MQADAESGFHPVAHASRYCNYVISRRLPTVGDRQRVLWDSDAGASGLIDHPRLKPACSISQAALSLT